jgi:hypothetical protein
MVGVMGKLSAADRKIFAQSMGHMEQRMMNMKTHRKDGTLKDRAEPVPAPSPMN